MVKNKISTILRFAISFGLLILLVWLMRKDSRDILDILKKSNKAFILSAISINALLSIALAYRLKLLMSGQKILISIKDACFLTFIGYFFNNFLPTAIGGDIAKAYYASQKTNNKVACYAAVLADRLLGLIATSLIALIGIFFIGKSMDNKFIVWIIPCVFILTLGIMMLLLKKNNRLKENHSVKKGLLYKIKEKSMKLYDAINLYRNSPMLLVKGIALSIGLQAVTIFSIYLLVLSIGGDINLLRLFLIIPIVWAVSMLPSLNGLGVREGAFVYFLRGYIGPEKAFAISLLWLGLIMIYSVVGGLFQLLYPVKIKPKEILL